MSQPPTGTVTFLFTDIEGSTTRWEQHPEQMQAALQRHDAFLTSAIEAHGGYIFKTMGDAFCAAFSSPHDALRAALLAQGSLYSEEWPEELGPVRVRIALHTGVSEARSGDYFGPPSTGWLASSRRGTGGRPSFLRSPMVLCAIPFPRVPPCAIWASTASRTS